MHHQIKHINPTAKLGESKSLIQKKKQKRLREQTGKGITWKYRRNRLKISPAIFKLII